MDKKPTVMVCLDDSSRASNVYKIGMQQAKAIGADAVLFRAVSIPVMPSESLAILPLATADTLLESAHAELERISSEQPKSEVQRRVVVELGSPWDTICRVAKEQDVALVVIGSHGYGGLDRLLGTTAAKVVNHAHCSVLVVRDEATE